MSALIPLWLLSGLIVRGEAKFTPTPAEPEVPALFRLESATFPYEMRLLRIEEHYRVWSLRFPSPLPSNVPENDTVHAEYFVPNAAASPTPGVVVLHILGADFALSRYMAARYAQRGVAALFVMLPYYGDRRPADDTRFLSVDLARSVGAMRQGVCDVRRAIAWLGNRPEIDPGRLGVSGISLGGIVSALAASADPAIDRAALLLAGGDLAEILWTMPEAKKYREIWIAAGRTKEELRTLTRPFDPLTYAHRLRGKRILMMSGKTDDTVPPECARALWEGAGRPEMVWLDCGHYSAVGYLLPSIRRAADFLATAP